MVVGVLHGPVTVLGVIELVLRVLLLHPNGQLDPRNLSPMQSEGGQK